MATSPVGDPPRRTAPASVLVACVAVLLVGALVAVWGWRGGPAGAGTDAPVMTAGPTAAAPQTPEAAGTTADEALATATSAPRRTPAPTASPAPAPAASQAPAAADVLEEPLHVTISRGTEVLVDARVALTNLNGRSELNPPAGVVGWYGPPDWATVPGELSAHPGVLAGHTTYDGSRDVFYRLGEVRAGDIVRIRYLDGQKAVFLVDADALSVPKNDVTDKADGEYAWVWRLPEPGRKVSLFSCDLAEGLDVTGHSLNNWVVQATRTS